MYIDVIILLILLVAVIFIFRKFSSFVYAVAIIDIFLRILTFVRDNSVPELHNLIAKYFPESIPAIMDTYTNGILFKVLMWIYVGIFIVFLFYITKYFIHKRK